MSLPENVSLALYLDGANVGTIDLRQMAAHIIRQTVATLEAQGRLLPAAPVCPDCSAEMVYSANRKAYWCRPCFYGGKAGQMSEMRQAQEAARKSSQARVTPTPPPVAETPPAPSQAPANAYDGTAVVFSHDFPRDGKLRALIIDAPKGRFGPDGFAVVRKFTGGHEQLRTVPVTASDPHCERLAVVTMAGGTWIAEATQ